MQSHHHQNVLDIQKLCLKNWTSKKLVGRPEIFFHERMFWTFRKWLCKRRQFRRRSRAPSAADFLCYFGFLNTFIFRKSEIKKRQPVVVLFTAFEFEGLAGLSCWGNPLDFLRRLHPCFLFTAFECEGLAGLSCFWVWWTCWRSCLGILLVHCVFECEGLAGDRVWESHEMP